MNIGAAMGFAGLVGLFAVGSSVCGQVVERDTRLTGPRGRTIERQVRSERGPGYVERDIRIQRPAGTYERDVRVQGPRAAGMVGPQVAQRNIVVGGPRNVFIERNVIVEPAPIFGFGPAPFFSFFFGAPPPPPPPPVIFAPAPVFVAPPNVVYSPPQPFGPVPRPAPAVVVDPVNEALVRLRSTHNHSRRDGALALGRMRDPRAVSPLLDKLANDLDKEVRVAAAWALGEIGDPRAALGLQRAALYDRRKEVRDTASAAYARLPQQSVSAPTQGQPSPTSVPPTAAGNTDGSPDLPDPNTPPPPPTPASSADLPEPLPRGGDRPRL